VIKWVEQGKTAGVPSLDRWIEMVIKVGSKLYSVSEGQLVPTAAQIFDRFAVITPSQTQKNKIVK
jgi:hypothetical protein